MLTRKQEDYLETIDSISAEKGFVRVKDIARNLGVSPASVTSMLQTLGGRGMIRYAKNEPVIMNEEGRRLASLVKGKHATFISFFELIGVPGHIARKDSMKIEHNLSPVTIEKMRKFVEEYSNTKKK